MFKEKKIMFLIAETPIHAGSGSGIGVIDLPIQRERHTNFPKIESSGLKGCLRDAMMSSNKLSETYRVRPLDVASSENETGDQSKKVTYLSLLFGSEVGETFSGAVSVTDAKILLFPVKSLKGIFCWITCPMVLERFKRDLKLAGINDMDQINFSNMLNTVSDVSSNIVLQDRRENGQNTVVLEEYSFIGVKYDEGTKLVAELLSNNIFPTQSGYSFWNEKLKKDLFIVDDDIFGDFVRRSTEIVTRTRIDEVTGTVKEGALWNEEYLPQDTVLYSLVMFTEPRVNSDNKKGVLKADSNVEDKAMEEARKVSKCFEEWLPEVVQIGGNHTIGKGFVRIRFYSTTGGNI